MPHPFLPDRPVDEAASLHSLAQGGLPLRAQRRISEHNRAGQPCFTSTFSPAEGVVATATGISPVSQVMGSSVYHVGFSGYASYGGGELAALTTAYEQARSLALGRMQQEATLLGAHTVVDVRFERREFEWGAGLLEFQAIGTAVRLANAPLPERATLTLLSVDDLYKLHLAGYAPVAIAMGNCFWYENHADCAGEGSWFSQELTSHTRAARQARSLAVERFRHAARHFNAHGVVGTRVERVAYDREYEVNDTSHTAFHLDLVVMGTAVVRRENPAPPPRPLLVVDLNDRSESELSFDSGSADADDELGSDDDELGSE
ncbi:MAG TPA: heavy metal-binding domain-containing protein [Polyangiaceae bacterium]|jgi:uncharacterized protein YbjQ (UPF0145 family)|nr:heavy metal-binding domain-containing protein [Polyangiaceae bacterium]